MRKFSINIRFLSDLQGRELGEIFRFSFSWIFSTYLSVCNTSDLIPSLTSDRYTYLFHIDINVPTFPGSKIRGMHDVRIQILVWNIFIFYGFSFFFSVILNFFQLKHHELSDYHQKDESSWSGLRILWFFLSVHLCYNPCCNAQYIYTKIL